MSSNQKKRVFVKVDETILISEIQKRPVLYDLSQRDYKRQASRQKAWDEVAQAVGLDEADVKKRWRSMRDAFIKHVKNANDQVKGKMLHYKLLEFLIPYVTGENARYRSPRFKKTETTLTLDPQGSIIYIQQDSEMEEGSYNQSEKGIGDEEEYLVEEYIGTDQNCEAEEEIEEKVVVKRKRLDLKSEGLSDENETLYTIEDNSRDATKVPAQTSKTSEELPHESSDEKFLLSLAPALQRLSNKKNYLARIKIQQLLYELEFDEKF